MADGAVYVASSNRVVAFEAATGAPTWELRIGNVVVALGVSGPTVYAAAQGRTLIAIDTVTGDDRWRTKVTVLPDPLTDSVRDGDVRAAQALAGDDVLLVSSDSFSTVDRATGERRWEFSAQEPHLAVRANYGAPNLVVADDVAYVSGGALVEGTGERRFVFAVDLATGTERWRVEIGEGTPLSAPVVTGGRVYVVGDGVLYALGDSPTGTGTPSTTPMGGSP